MAFWLGVVFWLLPPGPSARIAAPPQVATTPQPTSPAGEAGRTATRPPSQHTLTRDDLSEPWRNPRNKGKPRA